MLGCMQLKNKQVLLQALSESSGKKTSTKPIDGKWESVKTKVVRNKI